MSRPLVRRLQDGTLLPAPDFPGFTVLSRDTSLQAGDIWVAPYGQSYRTPGSGSRVTISSWGHTQQELHGPDMTYAAYRPAGRPDAPPHTPAMAAPAAQAVVVDGYTCIQDLNEITQEGDILRNGGALDPHNGTLLTARSGYIGKPMRNWGGSVWLWRQLDANGRTRFRLKGNRHYAAPLPLP